MSDRRLMPTESRTPWARAGRRLMRFLTPIRVPEYRAAWGQSLADWDIYLRSQMFDKTHYRGIPIWKNPLDLWIFQEIVHETKPRVIVEIGSRFGGTTLFLGGLLELILPEYQKEGKSSLTLAIGCTGGRHRSVAIAEALGRTLSSLGLTTQGFHRDASRSL